MIFRVSILILIFHFWQFPRPDELSFVLGEGVGSSTYILGRKGKLRFKPPHSGVKPYNIGKWIQKGDSISFDIKNSSLKYDNFLLYKSVFFDALVPFNKPGTRSYIRKFDVNKCTSDEIVWADSLVMMGAKIRAWDHPRSSDCIMDYFMDQEILIRPKEIYN